MTKGRGRDFTVSALNTCRVVYALPNALLGRSLLNTDHPDSAPFGLRAFEL